MKNYTSLDGLLLAVISCNRKTASFEDWISTMDYIDRSIMSCDEIETSLSHLIAGGLLEKVENKFVITKKGKKILSSFSSWFKGVIDWQLKVRERIVFMQYDETNLGLDKLIVKEDYDTSFEKYNISMQNEIDKMKVTYNENKLKKKELAKYVFYITGSGIFLIFLLILCVGCLSTGIIDAGFSMIVFSIYFIVFSYCINSYKNLKQGKSIKGYKLFFNRKTVIVNIFVLLVNVVFFTIMSFFMWQYIFAIAFLFAYVFCMLALFHYILKDKKPKKNIATKRYVDKAYGESYFINGVDILNAGNREELREYNIELMHPITKKVWCKKESIYRIKGMNFPFYLAVVPYPQEISVIYFLTYKDAMKISSEIHNEHIFEDYNKNQNAKEHYLQNKIQEQANGNYIYSNDFMLRARTESVIESVKVHYEFANIGESFGGGNIYVDNDYEYMINSEFKFIWIEIEQFDCQNISEAEDKVKKYFDQENLSVLNSSID